MEYKPDFELIVAAGNRPDENQLSEVNMLLDLAKSKYYITSLRRINRSASQKRTGVQF